MASLTVENLTFRYPLGSGQALEGLSFFVEPGSFVTLCGPSGGGKTTLLRLLKPSLAPHGCRGGRILLDGVPLGQLNQREESKRIGFVHQQPEDQLVTDKVWHELAFGLESLGYETPVMRGKIAEVAAFFGMEEWFHRDVASLSGGQKQLLNLAGVLVTEPDLLLLDEPTSQLDPLAAAEFLSMLGRVNRELGTTILISEHRLEETLPLSRQMLVLESGRLTACGRTEDVGLQLGKRGHAMFSAMPAAMRIWAAADGAGACPVTVAEGQRWLDVYVRDTTMCPLLPQIPLEGLSSPCVQVEEVWFAYERTGDQVLRGLSLQARPGELLAVLGGNGSGKSTLLSLLAGECRPHRGAVKISCANVGLLPQEPRALFVKKTVEQDLLEVFEGGGLSVEERRKRLETASALCKLDGLFERHPYDLSGGEMQRAALCKVLLTRPDLLLLDEPTKGLDARLKEELAGILAELLRAGVCVIMVSHDTEFCARYARRCALLFDGGIATQGRPRDFFSGLSFYTTAASRLARKHIPQAVTVEEVIFSCTGDGPLSAPPVQESGTLCPPPAWEEPAPAPRPPEQERRRLPKRTAAALWMVLCCIPLTIFVGIFYLEDRKYLFISLLLVLEAMLPLFLVFEGRRPKARELVLIAGLCALAAAARCAFVVLPQVKPMMALVIVAGVAFGGETGFLVGAVSMLLSNILFQQGPWTPWQMFAMGLTGLLAGALASCGLFRRGRWALALYGFCAAVLIYGGVMNPATAVMSQGQLNESMLLAYYVSGLPMDLVHGLSTALFLWFGGPPMLEKLERIKQKYGLTQPESGG